MADKRFSISARSRNGLETHRESSRLPAFDFAWSMSHKRLPVNEPSSEFRKISSCRIAFGDKIISDWTSSKGFIALDNFKTFSSLNGTRYSLAAAKVAISRRGRPATFSELFDPKYSSISALDKLETDDVDCSTRASGNKAETNRFVSFEDEDSSSPPPPPANKISHGEIFKSADSNLDRELSSSKCE